MKYFFFVSCKFLIIFFSFSLYFLFIFITDFMAKTQTLQKRSLKRSVCKILLLKKEKKRKNLLTDVWQ